MKLVERWYSGRVYQDVTVVRWGHFGQPVIVFPTAGGDAEEIERMGLLDALGGLLEAGRIKVYSCDSVAGAAIMRGEGSAGFRGALLKAYQEFARFEMVPAIRADCLSPEISVVTAGASVGAFNAVSMLCRFPDAVSAAVGMSGTYDMARFVGGGAGEELYFATPMYFLPGLNGGHLEALRSRFAILASGEGRWENIGESWRMADVLGSKGIPNRVDVWGPDYDHDWPTWRRMLPQYLAELTGG
jgi:esterase/lipase superfamily enzyme